MIELEPGAMAASMGAGVGAEGAAGFPVRASIDSRSVGPGDLFFGLKGERADGGGFASEELGEGVGAGAGRGDQGPAGARA